MTPMTRLQLAAVFFSLSGVWAAEVVDMPFDLDPKISCQRQTIRKKAGSTDLREQLRGSFELYAVENRDFVLQFNIQIRRFQHYCPVEFGFQNRRTGQSVGLKINRPASYKYTAFFQASEKSKAVVQQHNAKVLCESMRVTIAYSAERGELAVHLRTLDDDVVADFSFSDVEQVSLESFYIETSRFNGVGTVWYDSIEKNIFVRGAVGPKFMAEVLLDDLVLKFNPKEA